MRINLWCDYHIIQKLCLKFKISKYIPFPAAHLLAEFLDFFSSR